MPIGSLGPVQDLRLILSTGCWEHEAWDPRKKIEGWTEGPVPFKPQCKECRKLARNKMRHRGLLDSQIERLYRKVGAPYPWGKSRSSSGGTSTKRRPSPYRPIERKLADNLRFVERLETEHLEANARAQATWEQVVRERQALLEAEPGLDQVELVKRVPDVSKDMLVYRQQTDRG
jgi:hypothetical protein